MTEGTEGRTYKAGDLVVINLTVEHDIDLNRVEATFELAETHRDPTGDHGKEYAIRFKGREVQKHIALHRTPPQARSTVQLEGRVTAEHIAGPYSCSEIVTEYTGGRRIPFGLEQASELYFLVVEEPVNSPKVTGVEFIHNH